MSKLIDIENDNGMVINGVFHKVVPNNGMKAKEVCNACSLMKMCYTDTEILCNLFLHFGNCHFEIQEGSEE